MAELKTEEAIIEAFQNLRTELESIHNKINDLTAEAQVLPGCCKPQPSDQRSVTFYLLNTGARAGV